MGKKTFPVNMNQGKVFITLGERLREERERLGLSQPKFAAIAGTTKQTLFSWEVGKTAPDGFQIAALAKGGVDVLYVLTGERDYEPPPALSAEERVMLDYFRQASKEVRRAALGALLGAKAGAGQQIGVRDLTMNNNTPGGVQVGYAAGKVSFKKGK